MIINITQRWREELEYDIATTINGTMHYIQTGIDQSAIYEIYEFNYSELLKITKWIRENIPDCKIKFADEAMSTAQIIIPTKESLMAFKLRWL